MTLESSRVVYVTTLKAPPIVRTGYIVLAPANSTLRPLTAALLFWLITTLTTIPEVKIQKRALNAIPLSVLPLTRPFPALARTRARSLFSLFLLIWLLLGVAHDALQHTELGFDYAWETQDNVHLAGLASRSHVALGGRFGLKVVVGWEVTNIIVHGEIGEVMDWRLREHAVRHHGPFGLRNLSPAGRIGALVVLAWRIVRRGIVGGEIVVIEVLVGIRIEGRLDGGIEWLHVHLGLHVR